MTTTNPGCLIRILQLLRLRPLPSPAVEPLPRAIPSPPSTEAMPKTAVLPNPVPIEQPQTDAEVEPQPKTPPMTYHLSKRLLSTAETSFYHVLRHAASDIWLICPKVRLGDLITVRGGDSRQWQIARNRIDRKHVDFVLCDPATLRPVVAIELDDASHYRPERMARDKLVAEVFARSGLPLLRIPVRVAYSPAALKTQIAQAIQEPAAPLSSDGPPAPPAAPTRATRPPNCPNCGAPMVLRTARRGTKAGESFYGCRNYPNCQQILPLARE